MSNNLDKVIGIFGGISAIIGFLTGDLIFGMAEIIALLMVLVLPVYLAGLVGKILRWIGIFIVIFIGLLLIIATILVLIVVISL